MSRLTPMQAHQQRVKAAQAGSATALDEAQRALQWLHTQRGLLSALASRQTREAHKAKVLPEITPYLQGVLQADAGAPDPVVAHAAVWAMDAGAWPLALQLGAYMVRHGLPAPDEFKRNAATLLCDLMADAALTGSMPAAQIDGWLSAALSITKDADMPDQTRAKAHKAIAYGLAGKTTLAGQAGDWKGLSDAALRMALDHLTKAEQLDHNAGVKKDIAAVQKLLTAAADTTHSTAADAPPSEPPAKPAATRKPAAAPTKRARKT